MLTACIEISSLLKSVGLVKNLKAVNEIVELSGLGKYGRTDLMKALAGKTVSTYFSLGEPMEMINASCATKDLETMMQLVYLTFTDIHRDEDAFAAWKEQMKAVLTNYATFFVSSTGRVYMKMGSSGNYSGRQVWGPKGASSGGYGMSYFLSSRTPANYNKSAIFSNTRSSHYTACGNRPVINGVAYYCHAPINHEGNPLRTTNQCGCANKPLGYIRLQNGTEILPKTNPEWEDPYKRAGRR